MKLKIASDLHLERYSVPIRQNILNRIYSGKYDFFIMAGDLLERCTEFKFKKNMIYVHGNHEFYKEGYDNDIQTNYVRKEKNRKFVCSTMFSKLDPVYEHYIMKNISDFDYVNIRRFKELFGQSKEFLEKEVCKDSIVVTHFVPTYMSLDPKYKTDRTNSFFITEFAEMIFEREPLLWIHGHTHKCFDYMLGKTRIICNPLGYPHEVNKEFNTDLIIDV